MHRAQLAAWAVFVLTLACGAPATPTEHARREVATSTDAPPTVASSPPPVLVPLWSVEGGISTVGATAFGARAVYVVVSQGRRDQRLYAIDRASGRATSRRIGADVELLRVDPLIVETWEGEQARWLGTRIVRLDDALEPVWRSELMNFSAPRYASGPLILVEQTQAGEYIGLDPEDGRVVFRLRSEPDGVMNDAVEARSFIVTPTEEQAILTDRETGEIRAVVDTPFGGWEVVGDRLVVALPDRLTAYDGGGREVWSRAGSFPIAPARTILSWSPDEPPGHSDVLFVWEGGRGLVAIDELGRDRWVYPVTDERAWGDLFQRGDRVLIDGERTVMLDAQTGRTLFTCPEPCSLVGWDEHGVLARHEGRELSFALYDEGGARRWRHVVGPLEGERDPLGRTAAALLPGGVATCSPEGVLSLLDRARGTVVATHDVPGEQAEESARCSLQHRDGLLLAITHGGAALFGPRTGDDVATPSAPSEVTLPTLPPAGEPAVRQLYVLSTFAPPPGEPLPDAYARGRATYRRARESFEAGRFEEAAAQFVEAYRIFFASDHDELMRLGLECCYNARVSVDRAGGRAYDALLTRLGRDERCRNIVIRAPVPSRPF